MDKWEVLSQKMALENERDDVFLRERIKPEVLRDAYKNNRAVMQEEDGRIVAYAAMWETAHPSWFELGSLFVVPDWRSKGIGLDVYRRRLALAPASMRCFVVTHNPKAVSFALRHGFQEATQDDWFDLAPFAIVCEPCDRAVGEKLHCPFRAVHAQCRLLVR